MAATSASFGAHLSCPVARFTRNESVCHALGGALASPAFKSSRTTASIRSINRRALTSSACRHGWPTVRTRYGTPAAQLKDRVNLAGSGLTKSVSRRALSNQTYGNVGSGTSSEGIEDEEINTAEEASGSGLPPPIEQEAKDLYNGLRYWCQAEKLRLRRHFSHEHTVAENIATKTVICRLTIRGPGIEREIRASGEGPFQYAAAQNASLAMVSELEKQGLWNLREREIAVDLSKRRKLLRHAMILFDDGTIERNFDTTQLGQGSYESYASFQVPSMENLNAQITASGSTPREAQANATLDFISRLKSGYKRDEFFYLLQDARARRMREALQDMINLPENLPVSREDLQCFLDMWEEQYFFIHFEEEHMTCKTSVVLSDSRFKQGRKKDTFSPIKIKLSIRGSNMRKAWEETIFSLVKRLKEREDIWTILQDRLTGIKLSITNGMFTKMVAGKNDLLKASELISNVEMAEQTPEGRRHDDVESDLQRSRSRELGYLSPRKDFKAQMLTSKSLPILEYKQKIIRMVNDNTFSIFSSKTGSGKSTQIPQIILDDAASQWKGGQCRVLCIQPRRIAAQLLAARVAQERNEVVGQTVGCIVRSDHREPVAAGGITYCTTGIALNMLRTDPENFGSYSHIILDEAHVRDMNIDFIMTLLKRYVAQRQLEGRRAPRILIMSATIDLDLFTSYFGSVDSQGSFTPAPSLSIPGNAYSVKHRFLDEILDSLTSTFAPEPLQEILGDDPSLNRYLKIHYRRFDAAPLTAEPDLEYADLWEKEISTPALSKLNKGLELELLMPMGLIAATILHILNTTKSGSILVFLPGISGIRGIEEYIRKFAESQGHDFSNEDLFRIITVHANFPSEMAKLRRPYPKTCRRILLATDVAEASVTIPDVKYVIDPGRIQRMIYDPEVGSRELVASWIGKSNAVQRAGRAGRTQPGEYFFLGTKQRFDTLPTSLGPDILRSDLRSKCIQAKAIAPDVPIEVLLEESIEPPARADVDAAINSLKLLRALNDRSQLTSLGSLISQFPVEPMYGKLILMGIIFRCLDPMISLGTMSSDSPPLFTDSNSKKEYVENNHMDNNPSSDHINTINIFKAFRKLAIKDRRVASAYAFENGLNFRFLYDSLVSSRLILARMSRMGLVPKSASTGKIPFGGHELNTNSDNEALIKALLLHCLFPQIARPQSKHRTGFRTKTRTHIKSPLRFSLRENFMGAPAQPRQLAIFNTMMQSDVLLFDTVTFVTPLMACLFGGKLAWFDNRFRIDQWLGIELKLRNVSFARDEAVHTVTEFHEAFDMALSGAFDLLEPSLKFDTISHREKFETQRTRFFKSLERAACDVLDADNHRSAFFSRV